VIRVNDVQAHPKSSDVSNSCKILLELLCCWMRPRASHQKSQKLISRVIHGGSRNKFPTGNQEWFDKPKKHSGTRCSRTCSSRPVSLRCQPLQGCIHHRCRLWLRGRRHNNNSVLPLRITQPILCQRQGENLIYEVRSSPTIPALPILQACSQAFHAGGGVGIELLKMIAAPSSLACTFSQPFQFWVSNN
jgi:hypothetical protein